MDTWVLAQNAMALSKSPPLSGHSFPIDYGTWDFMLSVVAILAGAVCDAETLVS